MKPMLILLRHGETEWNATSRLMSRTDLPLSEVGRSQARKAADLSIGVPINRVITSPLLRAKQTADLFLKAHALGEAEVDVRLRELDFGEFEGMTGNQIRSSRLSDQYINWQNGLSGGVANAEPMSAGAARGSSFLREIKGFNQTTLVVTHGYLIRLMLAAEVLGMRESYVRALRIDNCRFATLEVEEGRWRLTSFNVKDVSGIQDDKPTS